MNPENPYAAGNVHFELPPGGDDFIEQLPEPKGNPAGAGMDWIKEGFADFKQGVGPFIGFAVLLIVGAAALSFIPGMSLLVNLAMYVLTAGLLLNIRRARAGQGVRFETFFAGFQHRRLSALIGLGAFYLLFSTIILVVLAGLALLFIGLDGMIGLFGLALEPASSPARDAFWDADQASFLLLLSSGVLLAVFLYTALAMAFFFAGHIVTFSDRGLFESMKLSFVGCLRNLGALFVWSLVGGLLSIVAAIPCGLGLLVAVPVLWASSYQAYLDIFTAEGVA